MTVKDAVFWRYLESAEYYNETELSGNNQLWLMRCGKKHQYVAQHLAIKHSSETC